MILRPFNAVIKNNHLSSWADISKYHFKTEKAMLFLQPLRIYAMSNHIWEESSCKYKDQSGSEHCQI